MDRFSIIIGERSFCIYLKDLLLGIGHNWLSLYYHTRQEKTTIFNVSFLSVLTNGTKSRISIHPNVPNGKGEVLLYRPAIGLAFSILKRRRFFRYLTINKRVSSLGRLTSSSG